MSSSNLNNVNYIDDNFHKYWEFFELFRNSLSSQETFDNFLRIISLFNEGAISKYTFLHYISPFFANSPSFYLWFLSRIQCIFRYSYENDYIDGFLYLQKSDIYIYPKCGVSYRILPKGTVFAIRSGRKKMIAEGYTWIQCVLNDFLIQFPSSTDEYSIPVSRKTPAEDAVLRCEEERFELDVVIESHLNLIKNLEKQFLILTKFKFYQKSNYTLNENLGSRSYILAKNALSRIYGDKTYEVYNDLISKPFTTIPIVLKRLKEKFNEWIDAKNHFNKIWRDQCEKYNTRSLDCSGFLLKISECKTSAKIFPSSNTTTFPFLILENPLHYFQYILPPICDDQIFLDSSHIILLFISHHSNLTFNEKDLIHNLLHYHLHYFYFKDNVYKRNYFVQEIDENQIPYTRLFLSNKSWCLLFHLHYYFICSIANIYSSSFLNNNLEYNLKRNFNENNQYLLFIQFLISYIEGKIDSFAYEEFAREVYGSDALMIFTLDKLLTVIMKQFIFLINDELSLKLIDMFHNFGRGSYQNKNLYFEKTIRWLPIDNCFIISFCLLSRNLRSDKFSSIDNLMEYRKTIFCTQSLHKAIPYGNFKKSCKYSLLPLNFKLTLPFKLLGILELIHKIHLRLVSQKNLKRLRPLFSRVSKIQYNESLNAKRYKARFYVVSTRDFLYNLQVQYVSLMKTNSNIFEKRKRMFDRWYLQWCYSNIPQLLSSSKFFSAL